MGAVVDEETGHESTCIFCDSKDNCPHLVAVIDKTFAVCSGGALYDAIYNIREILSGKILAKLRAGENINQAETDDELAAIAQEAFDNYDSECPDDVYIDEYIFLSWLTEALIDFGADEPTGYIVEEGGPGQSSALTLLYAFDPKAVIAAAEKALSVAVADL